MSAHVTIVPQPDGAYAVTVRHQGPGSTHLPVERHTCRTLRAVQRVVRTAFAAPTLIDQYAAFARR